MGRGRCYQKQMINTIGEANEQLGLVRRGRTPWKGIHLCPSQVSEMYKPDDKTASWYGSGEGFYCSYEREM